MSLNVRNMLEIQMSRRMPEQLRSKGQREEKY